MTHKLLWIALFAILFLFFVQLAGTLVESVYILDLLKASLDEKAAGLLFFFSPALLLLFGKRPPSWLVWIAFALLFLARSLLPYLSTPGRLLASGIGLGAALLLIPLILAVSPRSAGAGERFLPAQGLALAVGLSVLLRTLNFSLDATLEAGGGWVGWLLGLILGYTLSRLPLESDSPAEGRKKGVASAAVGVVSVLTLAYFAFFSPAVIARWTEGSYRWIVLAVSGLSLGWVYLALARADWLSRIAPSILLLWNLLFTAALTALILSHSVQFPPTPASPAVVVGGPEWFHQALLAATLLLFPVIFFDFAVFAQAIAQARPTPRQLAPGFLLGILILVLLVFMLIFTNVWGYVPPVSAFFRGKFWLPLLILGALLTLLVAVLRPESSSGESPTRKSALLFPALLLGGIFILTLVNAQLTDRLPAPAAPASSLKVMTYNILQANTAEGEKAYRQQLALIRQVDPDILALQESDSARLGLGNNDYVRYLANKLGYYAYYGPRTVTGTFGTALLSRYPLLNPRSVFTFSDQDEIGTAEAEIQVGDRRFLILSVHPDGSDTAKTIFAQTLLERAASYENVIALGDYNLRGWEAPYQMIDAAYQNAWMTVYPSGISPDGLDMTGKNRIDHIFISPGLTVQDPVYLLPPESASDHPAHWAEISW